MKKFIIKTFSFIVALALLFVLFMHFLLPRLLTYTSGPSTKVQLTYSFENALKKEYDILIIGNSRIYRGVNPDFIPWSFNFSHDNDSYNQIFHKLIYLEKNNKKFKYLVLGTDYFQFNVYSSTRNYVYKNYLGPAYMNDYEDEESGLLYYIDFSRNRLKGLKLTKAVSHIKSNGQFIKPGFSTPKDAVERSSERLDFQVAYLNKIIDYCVSNNIKVLLVMPPARKNELNNYTLPELTDFEAFINKYTSSDIKFLNFSVDENFSDVDFMDITHLNELSADRFSKRLNDSLQTFIRR